MNEFLWVEKYRPKTIEECILPERIKTPFQEYVNRKEIPNLLLYGTAGVGKTTAAIAMCEEIGLDYMFINSSSERGIGVLREQITGFASTVSLLDTRKVVILDEADGLTGDAQDALRGCIEAFSENCTFILTCNFKAKLKEALHSRSAGFDFTLRSSEKPGMASLFFKRLKEILAQEGVEYETNVLAKIVEKFFPDFRRTLNELQRYASFGGIDSNTLSQVSDITNLNDLMKHLKNKDFSSMRKWVVLNPDIDAQKIYRKIYDSTQQFLKPNSIPQCVVILSKYQYQAAFVADQEVNLVACLTEIMVDCEFK